jgi:hypothetical protein
MSDVIGARVPGWFRLLAVLGLAWNAFGVYMYLKSVGVLGDPLAGLDPAHRALAQSVPNWVTGAFAVAVFAGLLGALLLVMLKCFAKALLILSVLAVLVQSVWIVAISDARAVEGNMAFMMPAVITLVGLLLVWLAATGDRKGWLT